MIEYVEIRSAATREIIGIIDTAKSIIWHDVYYGVGDFEIYAPCNFENLELLTAGNYVTRFDNRNVGIIEHVEVTYNEQDGRMIIASGRFAEAMLERRIIYRLSGNSVSPTILRGNIEEAARKLVTENAINCGFDSGRNIPELMLGASAGITKKIIDGTGATAEKQVTHDNLMTYTDALLEEYGLGAYVGLDTSLKLSYLVYEGKDRSVDNAAGNNPVIFSQDFDNLLSSAYVYEDMNLRNTALIGGEGEGLERFHSMLKNNAVTGSARREIFVDAKSTSKTYKDENDVEQTISDSEYGLQLQSIGLQNLVSYVSVETFDGEIDMMNGGYEYGEEKDYFLGDIVTIQDVEIGLYINARLLEVTEVQDENGYQLSGTYKK